ncbi:MAG TPA: hypothetical protein VG944_17445, partial [Fimbriimonas sp.]|nr:hypothetical protein [Fimbriimonas sp.]
MNDEVADLRCELALNPLGIDAPNPRLGWRLASERVGARQTAYRVSVEGLWDSGRVESDAQSIRYGGPKLGSGQRCQWTVELWDEDGNSFKSAPAWWEMGLMEEGDWKGSWIQSQLSGSP